MAAWFFHLRRPVLGLRIVRGLGGVYRLLADQYRIAELYDALLLRPLRRLSSGLLDRGLERGLLDGIVVSGTARGARGVVAHGLKYLQAGFAQAYLACMVLALLLLVWAWVR